MTAQAYESFLKNKLNQDHTKSNSTEVGTTQHQLVKRKSLKFVFLKYFHFPLYVNIYWFAEEIRRGYNSNILLNIFLFIIYYGHHILCTCFLLNIFIFIGSTCHIDCVIKKLIIMINKILFLAMTCQVQLLQGVHWKL